MSKYSDSSDYLTVEREKYSNHDYDATLLINWHADLVREKTNFFLEQIIMVKDGIEAINKPLREQAEQLLKNVTYDSNLIKENTELTSTYREYLELIKKIKPVIEECTSKLKSIEREKEYW